MAGDTTNAHGWAEADVYVGAVGSTGPTNLSTALDAAFAPVGLLDGDEGVTQSRDQDQTDSYAWGGILVRTTRSKHKRTFRFVCLEDNATTFGLINPGSSTATATGVDTRTVKVPTTDPRAFVIEYRDGTVTKRIHIPNGEVTGVDDITESESDITKYALTVTVYAASDGTLFKEILPTPAVPA